VLAGPLRPGWVKGRRRASFRAPDLELWAPNTRSNAVAEAQPIVVNRVPIRFLSCIGPKTAPAGPVLSCQTGVEKRAAKRFPIRSRSCRRSEPAFFRLPLRVSHQMLPRTLYGSCESSDQRLPPCHRPSMGRSDDWLYFAGGPYKTRPYLLGAPSARCIGATTRRRATRDASAAPQSSSS
jgi:hypothetical protein